jgi:hypothetical protein
VKGNAVQSLVTIYLDSHADMGDRWIAASHAEKHGAIETHLTNELQDGWRIVSICGFGGASDSLNVRDCLGVVLEK